MNENGRCVADTYGIGHKAQASCNYMEAASVVELSDATFLQMLQVPTQQTLRPISIPSLISG